MQYLSTRGRCEPVGFTAAVAAGLAPDGGLFLPAELPDIRPFLPRWSSLAYADLAYEFLRLFATDLPADELRTIVDRAYVRFVHPDVAPLVELRDGLWVLELFHGPTLAFKDFALQLLGGLYAAQIRRTNQPLNVLGATSGDTGAAAIHGLLGLDGVRIFILYPRGRVAPLQERQMACTGAPNVFPIAIEGNFDDCQRIVKDLLGDLAFRQKQHLAAVNSINLARILTQCVYYIHAWRRLPPAVRDHAEFIVPTGNFGNILSGWLAHKMGLPARRFCVATNQNDILYRFFTTGRYETGPVAPSLAPSMDIQVASNFERFLYYAENRDPARVRATMETLRRDGRWNFDGFNPDTFRATRANDEDIREIIDDVYACFHYVADPHTACAFAEVDPDAPTVVLGTAHPAKFPDTIREVLGFEPTAPALEALKNLPVVRHELPADAATVRAFLEEHGV
ncbi:MAG: threonine synthase [Opitutales bacterium]|jgi:threonine synthase